MLPELSKYFAQLTSFSLYSSTSGPETLEVALTSSLHSTSSLLEQIRIKLNLQTELRMPQSFADYDSQYHNTRQKHISFLPTSKSQQQQSRHRHHTSSSSLLSQEIFNHNHDHDQHHRKDSTHSTSTSAATSRSSTATSMVSHHNHGGISIKEASLKAQEIKPTSDVAEWAHQMHIRQRRSYWWCQGCFPKEVAEPLHIPKAVERAVTGRRVRINEPSHCYDI